MGVYVVDYSELLVSGVHSMQAAGVLYQCSLPRNRESEEQGVQSGVVKALTDITSSCQKEPLFIGRDGP